MRTFRLNNSVYHDVYMCLIPRSAAAVYYVLKLILTPPPPRVCHGAILVGSVASWLRKLGASPSRTFAWARAQSRLKDSARGDGTKADGVCARSRPLDEFNCAKYLGNNSYIF